MLAIVDYGVGNVQAFLNVYRHLGIPAMRARTPEEIAGASRLILPGVGAFDWTMTRLEESGLRPALDVAVLQDSTPVLGVCVGMQMMVRDSEEGQLKGLGWLDGHVRRLRVEQEGLPLPHMGWNDVEPAPGADQGLFADVATPRMYFLHSYVVELGEGVEELASTIYGKRVTVALRRQHICGIQCHPEKSHGWGVAVLRNFATM